MQTRLTVRVDRHVLAEAKKYAAEHGTTLSKLISDYLCELSRAQSPYGNTPILHRLSGILPTDIKLTNREMRGFLEGIDTSIEREVDRE